MYGNLLKSLPDKAHLFAKEDLLVFASSFFSQKAVNCVQRRSQTRDRNIGPSSWVPRAKMFFGSERGRLGVWFWVSFQKKNTKHGAHFETTFLFWEGHFHFPGISATKELPGLDACPQKGKTHTPQLLSSVSDFNHFFLLINLPPIIKFPRVAAKNRQYSFRLANPKPILNS